MALNLTRQSFEAEKLVGLRQAQVLLRAEALVPGAGREVIEPLLADACLFIDAADIQADRIVLEGTARCQAVYRQGEENTLRALTAQTSLNYVLDIPGAEPGMFSRVRGAVAHVEARYENGHMIFLVSCDLRAQVLSLEAVEGIDSVSGQTGLEEDYAFIHSVKLAAESSETALIRETVPLSAALDARATLMDWTAVEIESVKADLGGVRVAGRVLVETLISSGVDGHPAAVVRVPMAFDQLVEMPEWLTGDVMAEADVRGVRTQIAMAEDESQAQLNCEAELRVRVLANATDAPRVLRDIYATQGGALDVKLQSVALCDSVSRVRQQEPARGTALLGEGQPRIGAVIATRVNPVIGEWRGEGDAGHIEGVLEVSVLYTPAGSEQPAAARAEIPFALDVPVPLDETSMIDIEPTAAEASALMGDRLDIKAQLGVRCETRSRQTVEIVADVESGEPIRRRSGIVIVWPDGSEDAWSIGKRYAIPAREAAEFSVGKPLVLKV